VRTIGIISDTHGLLRPEALEELQGCDLILHAGDVGDPAILGVLGAIAPVHAVYGNTDGHDLRAALPATLAVDLGTPDGRVTGNGPLGPLAYVYHGDRDLDLDPVAAGIALVVSGHTHEPRLEDHGHVLYLNPGSAGPRRFRLPVSVARVHVGDGGTIENVEIVDIRLVE
jgi:putative phosphoesterase